MSTRPDAPRFEQPPLLPELAAPATAPAPSPRARPRPTLATVTELRPLSLDERAVDLVAALAAAGVTVDAAQARALTAAGVLAPTAWADPQDPPRRRAAAAETVAAIRQDVTRRRAEAAHARTRDGST